MANPPPPSLDDLEQFLYTDLVGVPPHRSDRGVDVEQDLATSLVQAVDGGQVDVEVRRFMRCTACAGRGVPEGVESHACPDCKGRGTQVETQGVYTLKTICPTCDGRATFHDRVCSDCDGHGGRTVPEHVTVSIPGGVDDGHRLRLEDKGGEARDGSGAGDLYLRIAVEPHPELSRDGNDLLARVELDPVTAREGGFLRAPVPEGEVEVRIAPGTTPGTELRLRGHGALVLGAPPTPRPTGDETPYRSNELSGSRGDLVVMLVAPGSGGAHAHHYEVLGVPPTATRKQVEWAYRRIARESHPDFHQGDLDAARRFKKASEAYAALSQGEQRSALDRRVPMLVAGLVLLGVLYALFSAGC